MQSNWTGIGIPQQDEAARLFVERVERLSGGRIEITNYDAEVLLGATETFTGVADGVADLAVTGSVYIQGMLPVGKWLWGAPYLVDTLEFYELMYQFMGVKELWREAYAEYGVMNLVGYISDEWGGMVSTVPIRKFSDYKGLKVRAHGVWGDWLIENGASTVTMPGGEIYMALQTGVLDAAAFGSPAAWAGAKVYEVADYYIDPPVFPYDITEIIMNLETFNGMPEDLQEIMLSASRIHNLDIAALTIKEDVKGREELKAGGLEFIRIPDDELIKAKEWTWQRFKEEAADDPYIARLYDISVEAMKIKEAYYGPKRHP
jgi:TRAP-type C4-dicarboxylate transport system substrate-binding protein